MSMLESPQSSVSAPVSAVAWQGLRNVSWLESLSDERLSVLAGQCRWHRLETGQVLQGAYTDRRIYMLISGQLSVAGHSISGRAMIVGYLGPGFFFGAFAAQPPRTVAVQVQATQASLVASLSNTELEALIMSDVQVMRAVIQRLNELTGVLARRVVSLGTLTVRGRLHAQLLERAEMAGVENDEALLSPAPRQNDLALMLGTSREEVAREMSRLTRLGLLRREGRNLRLCRVDGLRLLLEEAH
ncbi:MULTISPECIES: Crp/Fnr family transcriptional regulator [Comamonas]|uniref:Cyclic nucleotide-binding protein n=1 Tax=Comamonas testosteroni TaxID=285 RepID=A0A096FKA4_COMTE|nr:MULTISPECIES: Crp/Fnr family transcriptional regulator [Comamonas]KGH30374.1 cyclic nucleotide-binding protein [Comamonas testosteroni]MPT11442.1 Crp/Fnr family transcriptional regulator [Comamonas sp.]